MERGIANVRVLHSIGAVVLLGACHSVPAPTSTLPDESRDYVIDEGGGGGTRAGTTPIGPEAVGTAWRFVEAHCTEGEPTIGGEGFSQTLRIEPSSVGFRLVI